MNKKNHKVATFKFSIKCNYLSPISCNLLNKFTYKLQLILGWLPTGRLISCPAQSLHAIDPMQFYCMKADICFKKGRRLAKESLMVLSNVLCDFLSWEKRSCDLVLPPAPCLGGFL